MAGVATTAFLLLIALVAGTADSFLLNKMPLSVAAFNIQHFGRSKMADTKVADIIVSILSRYDLILVQEVRDNTGDALKDLWSRLNTTDHWSMLASEPVGRKSYKEQYVFFYRSAKARCVESHSLNDTRDVYERNPFVAVFEYFSAAVGDRRSVAFLALHSKPLDAYEELEQLAKDIVSVANEYPKADGVISMGDFNADCSYVSKTRLSKLQIFNDDSFTSLIPHETDTTSGDSDCAYDRVIIYGKQIEARDADVFNFQTEYGLSENATMDVSDHYPVWFKLY